MTDVSESVLFKVRALLAQAESTPYPEEAEAFTAKAEQMMIKHTIDQAMLADLDPSKLDQIVYRDVRIDHPHLEHKGTSLYNIAKALGVRGAYVSKNRREKDKLGPGNDLRYSVMGLVGYESDVEWVETLFTSLEVQRTRALTEAVRSKAAHEHGRSFTADFNDGFLSAVLKRIRATREQVVKEHDTASNPQSHQGKSVALVLVGRQEQVDQEYRARFPGARERTTRTSLRSYTGYGAGKDAGNRASIARGSIGSKKGLNR